MLNKTEPSPTWPQHRPSAFTRFLWWLATAEKELLTGCLVDGNRYSIVGMTVLATWIFASLAWTYFFSTVMPSPYWAVLPGLLMGGIVLTIDRALIKTINKQNKKQLLPLLFRMLIALTIGFFMAQPALLYLFDKEIQMQASLDHEKQRQQKRTELDVLYKNRKTELLQTQQALVADDVARYEAVNKARQAFIAETDGSGGTGKVGIKDIALAKKREYEKLDAEYQALSMQNRPQKDSIAQALITIEQDIQKAEQVFTSYLNNGFLTRVAALQHLLSTNSALQWRYYLIVCLLILIELMPVIAKYMLPYGNYDQKVALQEAMELALARSNTAQQQELKQLYNQLAHDSDRASLEAFFKAGQSARDQRVQQMATRWQQDDEQAFDGLWGEMRDKILTKQEP